MALAYLEGLGLCAVVVNRSGDVRAQPPRAVASTPGREITSIFWTHSPNIAAVMAAEWAARGEGAEQAESGVPALAAELGIAIETNDSISVVVDATIDSIEQQFRDGLRSGVLKTLNRRYAEYRATADAGRQPCMRYSFWLQEQKVEMVRIIAAELRGCPFVNPPNRD
jgi:hypothetical protein